MCWSRLWYGIVRPLQYVVNAHAGERANGMTFVAVAKINFRIVDKIRFHGAENDEILFSSISAASEKMFILTINLFVEIRSSRLPSTTFPVATREK